MKKGLAVLLILLGLLAGAYAVERYMSYGEYSALADTQEEKSKTLEAGGDLEEAAIKLEYSAENLATANDAMQMVWVGSGAAVLLIIVGLFMLKSKE